MREKRATQVALQKGWSKMAQHAVNRETITPSYPHIFFFASSHIQTGIESETHRLEIRFEDTVS